MDLAKTISLITGGTGGIGSACAMELAQAGSEIALADLRDDSATVVELRQKLDAIGRKCYVVRADVSTESGARCAVERTVNAFGGIDVLVHCAGGAAPGGLMELSTEAWHAAFDIHVHSVFHLCRAAVPHMRERGSGAIVLISSVAGLRGCPGALAYGVAKGAIPQFTRALARELAGDNIRVNCVSPGIIRTRFQDYLTPEQVKDNIERRIPLRREGQPVDVAQAIAMLVTNEFITGENIAIDGGMSMRIV